MSIINKDYIKNNLFDSIGRLSPLKLKNIEITKEYNWCESKAEYIFCILNDIKKEPKCSNKNCDNKVKYKINNKSYNKYCSLKCSTSDDETLNKLKNSINKNKIIIDFKLTKEYILENIYTKTKSINTKKFNIIIHQDYYWCKNIKEYIYCVMNGIVKPIKCNNENCNNNVSYDEKRKYNKFCSPKCSSNNAIVLEKCKNTNISKYGVEHSSKLKLTQEKKENTNKIKYGENHFTKTDLYKTKSKNTNMVKWGVDNPSKSKIIKEKIKNINIEKFGVDNYFKSDVFKENLKQQNIKKFGVYSNSQKNINNKEDFLLFLNKDENILKKFIENNFFLIEDFMSYFNVNNSSVNKIKHKLNINIPNKINTLKMQKEIFLYLNELLNNDYDLTFNNKNIIFNNKKKLELDIYETKNKIAIEFDGLLYHSFGISDFSIFNNYSLESYDKKKHFEKTNLCEKENIKLFHIFENEWLNLNKRNIWKSMLKNSFKLSTKIFARNTYIKDVSKDFKIVKKFLEENHIQGFINYKIAIALFDKKTNKMLSLMSFGVPRYNKNYEYELLRFCSKINYNIIGGGSKLLKYFEEYFTPKSLISYGNRRWTNINNNFYLSNGFTFDSISPINFHYFHIRNIEKLYNRQTLQKYKLEKYKNNNKYNIEYFDKKETNDVILYKNNYRKIYDCGNLIYKKIYK